MGILNRLKKHNYRKRINALVDNPPEIDSNKIVFCSGNDFSDNALALYEYMVSAGYENKYEIVWLVRNVDECRKKDPGQARFVKVYDEKLKCRTYEAHREIMSAKYIFTTHTANWIKLRRNEQIFVNLWHGCGYKGMKQSENRVVEFDYCTVSGPKYKQIQAEYFGCSEDKIIPTGLARNDWFRTNKSYAKEYITGIKKNSNSQKTIIWMPTYRKGKSDRLNDDTGCGQLGLPLVDTMEDVLMINRRCKELGVFIIIKIHNLQFFENSISLSNVIAVDNEYLDEKNINLYELMANTDALISDYSSAAIDYMLLDKPMAYILSDFCNYEDKRGWSMENVTAYMPGRHIYSMQDYCRFLEDVSLGTDCHAEWRNKVNIEVNTQSECYRKGILDAIGIAE